MIFTVCNYFQKMRGVVKFISHLDFVMPNTYLS